MRGGGKEKSCVKSLNGNEESLTPEIVSELLLEYFYGGFKRHVHRHPTLFLKKCHGMNKRYVWMSDGNIGGCKANRCVNPSLAELLRSVLTCRKDCVSF